MSSQLISKSNAPVPAVSFQEVGEEQKGQRIDNFLLARLKGVPKSRIYRIIRKGEVRVNKKRIKPEYKLKVGDLVRIPPVRVAPPRELIPPSENLQLLLKNAVLYEDDVLLIINKPPGLPVHGGTGVKIGLVEALRFIFPEIIGLELVHRIDKGTSGCLLLAKKASTLKALSAQFKHGEVTKTYHALVAGKWPAEMTEIDAPLLKQDAHNGERHVVVSNEGKSAQTRFAILESFDEVTLVEASPYTGRTHQIRVHAQLAGCPLLGDDKYSSEATRKHFASLGVKRLCLHAAELTFTHPETGKPMTISAPWESQFTHAVNLMREAGG